MAEYWSYNDYTLPRLPAGWDMQKYPYAIILGIKSAFGFSLVCHSELPTVRSLNGENVIGFNVGTKVHSFTFYRATDTDWVDKGEVTPTPSDNNVIWHYYNNDETEWVWCNNDLKDESGNVVYAASVPVPIAPEEPEEPEEPETPAFDLRSWLTGYALGLCGKPLPFSTAQKEPVAYLYNGVRLPKLPEWDRGKYPYAFIIPLYGSSYRLTATQSPLRYGTINEQQAIYAEAGAYCTFGCKPSDAAWANFNEFNGEAYAVTNLVWASHDVTSDTDGTVYFAASEPVPVYE